MTWRHVTCIDSVWIELRLPIVPTKYFRIDSARAERA